MNSACPFYKLKLITSGNGLLEFNQRIIQVNPGDIIFIPAGSKYRITWFGSPDISFISMHFYFLSSPPIPRNKRVYIQILPTNDTLSNLFNDDLNSFGQNIAGNLIALSCLYKVLGIMLPQFEYLEANIIDDRIEAVVLYIESHYKEPLSINSLAAIAHMSTPHLHAKFKESTGRSPIEYRNHVRIRSALLELLKGRMSIEEISRAVGFDTTISFRRTFLKEVGCPPSRYVSNSLKQTTEVGVTSGIGPHEPIEINNCYAYRARINESFDGFFFYLPTYNQLDSKCQISIYEWHDSLNETLFQNPIASRYFDPMIDCAKHQVDCPSLSPGDYLFCITNVTGKVGVWTKTNVANPKGISYIGETEQKNIEPLLLIRFLRATTDPFLFCT